MRLYSSFGARGIFNKSRAFEALREAHEKVQKLEKWREIKNALVERIKKAVKWEKRDKVTLPSRFKSKYEYDYFYVQRITVDVKDNGEIVVWAALSEPLKSDGSCPKDMRSKSLDKKYTVDVLKEYKEEDES